MKQEVESMVSISNGYLYWHRVGEMGENARKPDVSDRMLSI